MIPRYINTARAYREWRNCVQEKKDVEECQILYDQYKLSIKEVASLIAAIANKVPYDPSQEGYPPKKS